MCLCMCMCIYMCVWPHLCELRRLHFDERCLRELRDAPGDLCYVLCYVWVLWVLWVLCVALYGGGLGLVCACVCVG
jgi:hypothetical protein